jgi:RNA polymerase sigma-70 factor (ECF subfamily)
VSVTVEISRDQDCRIPDRGLAPEYPVSAAACDQRFAELVDLHGAALLRFLVWLTRGDRERSEDIYQETLLRAWKHPECYQQGAGPSRKWLFTVARRISIDQLRATAVRPALVSDEWLLEVACDPVDAVDRMLLAAEVRAAMATLSAAHQEVIRQMYFQDRPAAEVAQRLGLPEGTVKSRTYYALRALKDALEQAGLENEMAEGA